MALAAGATQFVTYASLNFTTLFLMREKGMTLNEVAIYYALLIGVGISAGMYTSGRLIDKLAPRGKQAYAIVPAVGLALAIPFFIGFVWAPTWPLALLFSGGADLLQLLLSLAGRRSGAGGSAGRRNACWRARCCCSS